ncbi:DNA alkylation repair protein [candidate division WOR-3 bacterium]|nr:DNA alkylation repair protein [candidate division WOR-3 bacterium]
MFRESRKDKPVLEKFLDEHCTKMPRTMLRYSIEKFNDDRRKYYLNKKR